MHISLVVVVLVIATNRAGISRSFGGWLQNNFGDSCQATTWCGIIALRWNCVELKQKSSIAYRILSQTASTSKKLEQNTRRSALSTTLFFPFKYPNMGKTKTKAVEEVTLNKYVSVRASGCCGSLAVWLLPALSRARGVERY
jgi:hypothetical protein